jgi:hypothetical protein
VGLRMGYGENAGPRVFSSPHGKRLGHGASLATMTLVVGRAEDSRSFAGRTDCGAEPAATVGGP